jgi:hypothetical protein
MHPIDPALQVDKAKDIQDVKDNEEQTVIMPKPTQKLDRRELGCLDYPHHAKKEAKDVYNV